MAETETTAGPPSREGEGEARPEPDDGLAGLERSLVPEAPRYALSHWLLRRGLGLTSLVAWISLAVQERSLFGPGGVFPMNERAARVIEVSGPLDAFLAAPSLFYLVEGDGLGLVLVTTLGIVASIALLVGVVPGPAALVSYAAYLSFVSLGAPFLPLQWDTLLCESLVLGAALSPWTSRDRLAAAPEPEPMARFVAWLLPSRILFASGLVKILGGDPPWRDGSAMAYHYWTQPLPSPLAPWAHAMPSWFHSLETLMTLVLEIGLPLLVFFGLRARAVLALGITFLMALIAATGSYGFFNLLTVVLAIALLDDATLARVLPARLRVAPARRERTTAARRAMAATCGTIFFLGSLELVTSIGLGPIVPDFVEDSAAAIQPLRITSSYGLFARMTTTRDELVFLATEDGEHWEEYDYRYKPGDPSRGPSWCTPHLPRFDWMLWFAAFDDRVGASWVVRVERGLREGREPIRALFAREPFEGRRPLDVRIERHSYHFGEDEPWERGPAERW